MKEFHVTDSDSDSFKDEKSNHVKIEESKNSSTNFSDAAVIKENTYLDTSKEIDENYFDSVKSLIQNHFMRIQNQQKRKNWIRFQRSWTISKR